MPLGQESAVFRSLKPNREIQAGDGISASTSYSPTTFENL